MLVWKNTSTLDGYDNGIIFTDKKEEADIVLMGSKNINIEDFPKLKGIFRAGIGKDNVPEEEAVDRGVLVRYPSKDVVNTIFDETASFTCSLIFKMIYMNIGTIKPWKKFNRVEISNKNLLVIGNGNIGRRVARLMNPFLKVSTFDIAENKLSDLLNFLKKTDCVTIHIPKTSENESFFDKYKLSLMKDRAIIINTSRGSLVDEDALYDEIKSKRLIAAFDVFWREPYQGKLSNLHADGFHMTPHIASTCNGFLEGCKKDLDKLIRELAND